MYVLCFVSCEVSFVYFGLSVRVGANVGIVWCVVG